MKKSAVFLSLLILAGCTTAVPVKRTFPEAPPVLLEPVPELRTVDPRNARLSNVVEVSIDNMSRYHQLAEKYRAWQEWYNTQRRIFNEVNE